MRHAPAPFVSCLLWALLGCTSATPGEVGSACLTSVDCDEGQVCFETRAGDAVCMLGCEEGTRLCDDGEVCLAGASGVRVCYIGGTLERGQACMDGADCQPGLVCVSARGETRCQSACDTRTPLCGEGQSCVVLGEEPAGYCAVPTDEDAGMDDAGMDDAGMGGGEDSAPPDGGPPDSGPEDGGPEDGGPEDGGPEDGGEGPS